jgi:threonine/homoserine/homoserine lactone efflux protein
MLFLKLVEVYFLGLLCGLIPGPVVTSIFTETIRRGWRSGRRIVLWAAAGELVMSVVCVGALSMMDPHSVLFAVLSMFGALILLSLAWDLWRVDEISEEEPLFSRRRVFFLSLINGMAWIFWVTVCTPQAIALGTEFRGGQWVFIVLFELGWGTSTMLLCYLFEFFRPYFQSNKRLHHLYRFVAVLFLFFAGKLAIESGQSLLNL